MSARSPPRSAPVIGRRSSSRCARTPSKRNTWRNETNACCTSTSSVQVSTRPTPGTSSTRWVWSLVQRSQARRAGSRVEDQPTSSPHRTGDHVEHAGPLGVGDEDLRHVARHDREIEPERGDAGRVAVDPAHQLGAVLAPSHVERRRRRIDPDDLEPELREPARERAGAAPEVEHRRRSQLLDDRGVDVEVAPVVVHDVVQGGQPRVGEDRIRHTDIVDDAGVMRCACAARPRGRW